ncbi:MAG: hypothetical protein RLZZ437_1440 [Pseudomonadota bacterium]|jgi:RHS repeat-associated protein
MLHLRFAGIYGRQAGKTHEIAPVHSNAIDRNIAPHLHRDHLGSVRAITNATGARIESAIYKPYGEQTETLSPANLTPESKGWIGERYDADAGLQYLNARYYDPVLGLFLQPDWFEVLRPGVGTNRFSYSFNDPVNFSDPSGHERISPKFSKSLNDALTRTFEAIRSSLRKDVAAAGSLAARYDRGERTGWFARLGWSSSEQRLHREVRRDQNCTSGTTCSAVTGNTFRQYGANVSTILAGIGSSGSGVKVEMGNGPRSPTGGIATAPRPGTSTTIYGDFFLDSVTSSNGLSVPQTDSTRIGYLVHEMGHAY